MKKRLAEVVTSYLNDCEALADVVFTAMDFRGQKFPSSRSEEAAYKKYCRTRMHEAVREAAQIGCSREQLKAEIANASVLHRCKLI